MWGVRAHVLCENSVGLHHREGEGSQVSPTHCWTICCEEVQKSSRTFSNRFSFLLKLVCNCALPFNHLSSLFLPLAELIPFLQCPIVERLTNSLMMHGRNNGKKLMAVRIVKHAFEIIHLLTGEVSNPPMQPPVVVECGVQYIT